MRVVVPGAVAACLVFAAMAGSVYASAAAPSVAATLAVAGPGVDEVRAGGPPPEPLPAAEADPIAVAADGESLEPATELAATPRGGLPAGLIAYTLDTGTATDVFVRRLDSPSEWRVTTSAMADSDPDLSPDGRLVAYQGHSEADTNDADIFVVGVDGQGRRNLTRAPDLGNHTPAFSPDGRRIAFTSNRRRGGAPTLWIMAADGSDMRALTRRECIDADWSPDGHRLVCAGDAVGFGARDLWLVDAETGEMLPLTATVEREIRPTWSPDGRFIAYQMNINGGWMVTVLELDGISSPRQIGAGTNPVWAPDGTLAWAGPFGLSLLAPPFDGPPLVPGDIAGRLGSWAE